MKTLELNQMQNVEGGSDFVDGMCLSVAVGSGVYGVGLIFNWWNPIGWVSAAFLVADFACGIRYA